MVKMEEKMCSFRCIYQQMRKIEINELSVQCKKLEKGQNKLEKTVKTNKDKDTNRRQRQNRKQMQKQTHENS